MKRRRRVIQLPQEDAVLSEINITPLTDVLLVLLIIFLVTATEANLNAFNMHMPASSQTVAVKLDADYVLVTISARHDVFIGDVKADLGRLTELLKLARSKKGSNKMVIRADSKARYRYVVRVMDAGKQAGLTSIALATEFP
ncbi:MAG TPA: biopolymer transporter ExbD [Candidatus Nitrosotenuis sp.]|jgi:biopolymer transport protein ExbD|nr:biopolymer transporter ExbD [Candidatus Nitrosotenuis sp.]